MSDFLSVWSCSLDLYVVSCLNLDWIWSRIQARFRILNVCINMFFLHYSNLFNLLLTLERTCSLISCTICCILFYFSLFWICFHFDPQLFPLLLNFYSVPPLVIGCLYASTQGCWIVLLSFLSVDILGVWRLLRDTSKLRLHLSRCCVSQGAWSESQCTGNASSPW